MCAGVVTEDEILIHEAVCTDVVELAGIHDPLAEDRCAVYEVHVADAPVGDGTVREEVTAGAARTSTRCARSTRCAGSARCRDGRTPSPLIKDIVG